MNDIFENETALPSFLGGVSEGVSGGVSGVLVKVLVTSKPLSTMLSGLLTEFSGGVGGGGRAVSF